MATICKGNPLKAEKQNSNYDETRSFTNLDKTQFLQYQNHVQVGKLERTERNDDFGVGYH